MKQTINANIGQQAFIVDEDAYQALAQYLDDIRTRLNASEQNIADNVERRVAELLREQLTSTVEVVTIDMVRQVIVQIGQPDTFGEKKAQANANQSTQRLVRRRNDRMIAGVCAGWARYLGTDTALIRVIALLAFILGSVGFWIYIILWICIPYDDNNNATVTATPNPEVTNTDDGVVRTILRVLAGLGATYLLFSWLALVVLIAIFGFIMLPFGILAAIISIPWLLLTYLLYCFAFEWKSNKWVIMAIIALCIIAMILGGCNLHSGGNYFDRLEDSIERMEENFESIEEHFESIEEQTFGD